MSTIFGEPSRRLQRTRLLSNPARKRGTCSPQTREHCGGHKADAGNKERARDAPHCRVRTFLPVALEVCRRPPPAVTRTRRLLANGRTSDFSASVVQCIGRVEYVMSQSYCEDLQLTRGSPQGNCDKTCGLFCASGTAELQRLLQRELVKECGFLKLCATLRG